MKGLATRYAPSFPLVRAHFALGVGGSVAVAAALFAVAWNLEGHHFQARLLGVVHLAALLWLLPIALGALLQLLPVLFEVPLVSERAAWLAFGLLVTGAGGFVFTLATFRVGPWLSLFASLLAAGVWLAAGHLALSGLRSARGRTSLTGGFVLSALAWLVFAATVGLVLALNLSHPFLTVNHLEVLRGHAAAAGLGFFGLLIMGVGFELFEMFLLSHGAERWPGWLALGATNLGLLAVTFDALFGPWVGVTGLGTALVAVGAVAFAWRVRRIFQKRMKRALDTSAWLSAGSVLCLLLAVTFGFTLLGLDLDAEWRQRVVLAFGLLAIPGFMGLVVVGQLFKIVPFLVWMHRFSGLVGLKKVPTASELVDGRARWLQGVLLPAGLLVLVAGVLGASPALRLSGAALYLGAMLVGAHHLWRISEKKP